MDKIKLLIAEDIKATVRLYDKAISQEIFDKKVAMDGQQALDLYKEWQPDIILLDLQMPILNGYTVLKTVRRELTDLDTIVIVATTQSDLGDVKRCAELGVQGYIVKPFNLKELEEKILNVYARQYPDKALKIQKLREKSQQSH